MNTFPKIDTMEALRLTRDGRLQEAMAVLRGTLPNAAPSNLQSNGPSKPAGRTPSILDMMPPQPGTGGAWTAPQFGTTGSPGRPGATTHPQMPEALRGFMDRIGQLGHVDGIDGLVEPAVRRAPVPLPDGARFEERTYTNEAGSRAYKLYVPSGYTGQALPLVVMLHGCTQSPDDFAAGTQMNELAEELTFLVAYPAQPKSANMSKCWNWFNESDQQRDRGEPSLIAGITRQIMRDFPVEFGPPLYRRSFGRWRRGRHHGFDLSGPLCSHRRAFRTGLRGGPGYALRLRRHAAGWDASRCRFAWVRQRCSDHRVSW